jgi:hypothetical protein
MTLSQPAPGLAWTTADDHAYVARMPSGPIVVLSGPAAVIWDELTVDGDTATLTARVTARLTNAPDDADAIVHHVVEQLRSDGLLADAER